MTDDMKIPFDLAVSGFWTSLVSLALCTIISLGCQFPCAPCREQHECPEGVPLVLDGCQCCHVCAGQHGQTCDTQRTCDSTRNLTCTSGVCTGTASSSLCVVEDRVYRDGEKFKRNCASLCTCQGGSYTCTSLCPHELIRPSASCRDPVLVSVPGECCRQWRCTENAGRVGECRGMVSEWTSCSTSCGLGVSMRTLVDTSCSCTIEERLCQERQCLFPAGALSWTGTLIALLQNDSQKCWPTHRTVHRTHLYWGSCRSVRQYRPRYCSLCPGQCCEPAASTTEHIQFICPPARWRSTSSDGDHLWREEARGVVSSPPLVQFASRVVVSRPVMWIEQCSCVPC